MAIFFAAVWDQERLSSRLLICSGNADPMGHYIVDSLPVMFIPDAALRDTNISAIRERLWHRGNVFRFPGPTVSGCNYIVCSESTFRLVAELKAAINAWSDPSTGSRPAVAAGLHQQGEAMMGAWTNAIIGSSFHNGGGSVTNLGGAGEAGSAGVAVGGGTAGAGGAGGDVSIRLQNLPPVVATGDYDWLANEQERHDPGEVEGTTDTAGRTLRRIRSPRPRRMVTPRRRTPMSVTTMEVHENGTVTANLADGTTRSWISRNAYNRDLERNAIVGPTAH